MSSASISHDEFFRRIKPTIDDDYKQQFELAVDLYIGGPNGEEANWKVATELLEQCLFFDSQDGPAKALSSSPRSPS